MQQFVLLTVHILPINHPPNDCKLVHALGGHLLSSIFTSVKSILNIQLKILILCHTYLYLCSISYVLWLGGITTKRDSNFQEARRSRKAMRQSSITLPIFCVSFLLISKNDLPILSPCKNKSLSKHRLLRLIGIINTVPSP